MEAEEKVVHELTWEESAHELLQSRGVAVLATQGEDYPHACLVAFAVTDDLSEIVFVTNRKTRKFENMTSDDRVMLLVDNRTNTEDDFERATVITGRGRALPVDPAEAAPLLELYLCRHPYLQDFAGEEHSVLMRVIVDSYAIVTRFQETFIMKMDGNRDRSSRGGNP